MRGENMQTSDLKKLLEGTLEEKLEIVSELTEMRLARLLGIDLDTDDIPRKFEDILVEVTMKRLNRIGQEGMKSFSQEGIGMSFPDSDFEEYMNEINAYKKENDTSGYGRVRFL